MNARLLARQYALALYDVARKQGTLDAVRRDMAGLGEIVSAHDELQRVLASPGVALDRKKAVVEAVLHAAGGSTDHVRRLLGLLADRDRLWLFPEIATAFAERIEEAGDVVRARITTTTGLDEPRRQALASALSRAVGREVSLTEDIDPAIVGGVVARVGTVVFDGSVSRQIERLRARLLSDL